MKNRKRLFGIVLSVFLLAGGLELPPAYAAENQAEYHTVTWVNPIYADSVEIPAKEQSAENGLVSEKRLFADSQAPIFSTYDEAVAYLRQQLVQRTESISMRFSSADITNQIVQNGITDAAAYSDSCTGQEGDAITFGLRGYSLSYSGSWAIYTMTYHTTAAQEEALTSKVNTVMSSLNLDGKSEYDKVQAIYDYICANVTYDYTYQRYSAYNALIDGTSVCQGYAALFYRMCKEAGLSVRGITGTASGVGHAWNIVRIGEVYYNVDSTWDEGNTIDKYSWFLKSDADFAGHDRDEQYLTASFYQQFPMTKLSWGKPETGYDMVNLTKTFTTVEGGTVNSTADGKSKVLIFFGASCPNSRSTIESLTNADLPNIDIVAIESNNADKEDAIIFQQTYGSQDMTFCYGGNSAMWSYAQKVFQKNRTTFPVVVYIDADNKIQYATEGLSSAAQIAANLELYSGYEPQKVTSITLNKTSLSFSAAGETVTLIAAVAPDNAANKAVNWESSNSNVASVNSDGKVTAEGEGTATITARAADGSGVTATCKVTVTISAQGSGDTSDSGNTGDTGSDSEEDTGDTGNTGDSGNAPVQDGWYEENGAKYWYENGVRQGYDPGNEAYRGKEIWDPVSDAWYWLDNIQGGAVAVSKDVYQESEAGDWGDRIGADGKRYGKWVRYDENGGMIKGWDTTDEGTYFFDYTYGTMAKGFATIEGREYYFNPETGVLEYEIGEVPEFGWKTIDGKDYWYENYIRQGYSVDASYRGKEIHDPGTDAWYWLDNIQGGAKAVSKDVYQESLAGDWGDYTNENGERCGKWVRYDENGHMVKGWQTTDAGTYFFDYIYGTMAKGAANIDGVDYYFDPATGIRQ